LTNVVDGYITPTELIQIKFIYEFLNYSIMALNNKLPKYSSIVNNEYNLNLNWLNLNYEELLLDYKNKYVAVKDQNVIDSDFVFLNLLKRIEFNYKSSWKSIAILPINKERKIF
jgi:hypothetical protein